jgi:hypothetical protein
MSDIVKTLRSLGDHAAFEPHMHHRAADEIEKLRAALRLLLSKTYSHIDGRDLLGELHPRKTLDIKRRVDGVETWFEGDWLTEFMDARNVAMRALGLKP